MPISIVSNPSALSAQQSLNKANDRIGISTSRLSSGERVFDAREDAASLAISAGLKVEVSALRSAAINASTGSSMLQVAEGAIANIQDIAIRMKTVASQASSGQIGDAERELLDQEFQVLKAEIARISADTEFNKQPLLSGAALYDVDYAHAIQGDGFSAPSLDNTIVTSDATFRYTYDTTEETVTMSRIEGGTTSTQIIDITALMDAVAGVGQNLTAGESIPLNFGALGVSLTLDDAFDRNADIIPTITDGSGATATFTQPVDTELRPAGFSFATTNVSSEMTDAFIALDAGSAYNLAAGILTLPTTTAAGAVTLDGVAGVRYDVNGGGLGADGAASSDLVGANTTVDIYLTTASGSEKVGTLQFDTVTAGSNGAGSLAINAGQGLFDVDYTAGAGDVALDFLVGSSVTTAEDFVSVTISPLTVSTLGLTTSTVLSKTAAELSISTLNTALTTINDLRSSIGGNQSRLEFVAGQLATSIENNEVARSSLTDVDVAAEISDLASNQALAELGVQMLSRANQQPERLLELLRNS